jgi:hypothetical protein
MNNVYVGKSTDFLDEIAEGIEGVKRAESAKMKYQNFKDIEKAAHKACEVAKTWMTPEEIRSVED